MTKIIPVTAGLIKVLTGRLYVSGPTHYKELEEKYSASPAKQIIHLKKMVQSLVECNTPQQPSNQRRPRLSDTVADHFDIMKSPEGLNKKNKQTSRFVSVSSFKLSSGGTEQQPAVLKPFTLPERGIKSKTGFKNEILMLSFVLIICNGSFEEMTKRVSNLTWYEEWFFFFEAIYGRSHTCWDYTVMERYRVSRKAELYKIFDHKLTLVKRCRSSWPTYASYEEDKQLRKTKWDRYNGKRVVLWDDTNIPFSFKPSAASNQRITYSQYYAMCCAKGGVFVQLCGWLGVEELWAGHISDSMYVERSNILQRQNDFAQKDKVSDKVVPFTLILDKGYRIVRVAYQNGKQECLQPCFASSDRTFSSDQMLLTASVAADRSGNERAVHRCKFSGMLKRGLKPHSCPVRLNSVWECWSFQSNFMYKSVL